MRPSCLECTGKHLAQACELIKETKTGYPSFHWYVIGHLAEAEEETIRDYPDLANEIREYRVAWMDDHDIVIPFEELFELIDSLIDGVSGSASAEPDEPFYPVILISGMPRSGTTYAAKLVNLLEGPKIGHERITPDGFVDWKMPVAIRQPWWGFDDSVTVKLHQVRDPLRCISSLQAVRRKTRMQDYLNDLGLHYEGLNEPVGFMRFWVEWNKIVEEWADRTYRVEDMPTIFEQWCGWIGRKPDRVALLSLGAHVNTRRSGYTPYTWAQLREADASLCDEVQELARHYGYTEFNDYGEQE